MSTYFVSAQHGSDSNNGLGPDASHATNKPFATIGKLIATSGVLANADIAYLFGTFRQTITVNITSLTVEGFLNGDPGNVQGFKDSAGALLAPAEVVWTAYTTNDTTAPAAAATLTLNGRDFLTFQNLTIIGGNATQSCIIATATNSVNIVFRDCKIIAGHNANVAIAYTGLADIAANWTFDRCKILAFGGTCINLVFPTTSTAADYDVNFTVQYCELITCGGSGVAANVSGALSNKPGGVDVRGCFMHVRVSGLTIGANLSTTIPCTIYDSVIISGSSGGAALVAATSGQIIENYNRIIASSARTNVTAGANSISDMSHAPLFDLGFARHLGFASKPYWGPSAGSPLLGFGNEAGAASVDMSNRPRPAGGASTAGAIGPHERHDTARVGSSLGADAGGYIELVGPADHDFSLPVDASSTTLTVKVKWDATHADTNKPQAILLANAAIGVSTETKTATGTAGSGYETLTFANFTPTAKGVVTLRLVSRSAAGGGIAAFDSITGGANGSQGLDYFKNGEPLGAAVATSAGGGAASIHVHPGMDGGMQG